MDVTLAADLAWLSSLAYERDAFSRTEVCCLWFGAEPVFYDLADTQALVVEGPRFSAIAFRGTEVSGGPSLRDVGANLDSQLIPGPAGGQVHRGYYTALWRALPDVLPHLRRLRRPVYGTGHSLAGALITQLGALFDFDAIYTYGAPKPGDKAFWATLKAPVHRFVNDQDFAPLWPYAAGFAQGGKLWLVSDAGVRAATWRFAPLAIPFGVGLNDHNVDGYAKRLQRAADQKRRPPAALAGGGPGVEAPEAAEERSA